MGKNILTKELLIKSVEEWNEARIAYPEYSPDLREANLSGVDLNGANLSWVDLSKSNLQGANLRNANLFRTFLFRANLREASLVMANISQTFLIETDLSYAIVGYTVFGEVDLGSVLGLNTISHAWPSTIGIDTIYASNGDIPDVFLQGCGVPTAVIKLIRELNPKASDYYSCFISHSSVDKDFVKRLYDELKEKGVPCYYAPHDLPIGAKTRPTLHEEIRNHDKLLLVLTEDSVKSAWVEDEVEHAFELEKERGLNVLFPIRLDDAVMSSKTGWASSAKSRNIGDFTKWKDHDAYQEAFSRLLRGLKQSDNPNK